MDRISAAILEQLPSSETEAIGFNELLRRLEKRRVTNSPTTLANHLRTLQRNGLVRREVVRRNPPKLVKLHKDPTAIAALETTSKLKEQIEKTMKQNSMLMTELATEPLKTIQPSLVSLADSLQSMRPMIQTETLAELCGSLRKLQRQMLEMSVKIASITSAVMKLEKAVNEGRLSTLVVRELLWNIAERMKQAKPSR